MKIGSPSSLMAPEATKTQGTSLVTRVVVNNHHNRQALSREHSQQLARAAGKMTPSHKLSQDSCCSSSADEKTQADPKESCTSTGGISSPKSIDIAELYR